MFIALGLLGLTPLATIESHSDINRWSPVAIPAQGETGGWLLAAGSDARHFTLAAYGSLYAIVSSLSETLYRLEDGGASWSPSGSIAGDVVDLLVTEDGTVYCATAGGVYRSVDGGGSFQSLSSIAALQPGDNVVITAIDITCYQGCFMLAAAIADGDSGRYGGVYILKDETFPQ